MTKCERLAKKLEKVIPGAEAGSVRIYPAQGYYRQIRADCMPWHGSFVSGNVRRPLDSWDTVTNCLKGFEIEIAQFGGYEVYAL